MKIEKNILVITLFIIVNFILFSCEENKENNRVEKYKPKSKILSARELKIKDSIIGVWRLTEIQYRTDDEQSYKDLISRSSIRGEDSIYLDLKKDNRLLINNKEVGVWKLSNDSLLLRGKAEFNRIPLFLNTSYRISSDRKSCWYLTCTFFNLKGSHHQVRYSMQKKRSKEIRITNSSEGIFPDNL